MADAHLHESRSVALHSRLSFTTGMNNVNLTYGLRTYQIINSFDLGLPRRSLSWKFLPWTVGASHRRLGGHSRQPMCHTGPMRRVSCRGQFFFMKMDLIIFFCLVDSGTTNVSVYQFLKKNFDSHYLGNRSPYTLSVSPAWFQNSINLQGFQL